MNNDCALHLVEHNRVPLTRSVLETPIDFSLPYDSPALRSQSAARDTGEICKRWLGNTASIIVFGFARAQEYTARQLGSIHYQVPEGKKLDNFIKALVKLSRMKGCPAIIWVAEPFRDCVPEGVKEEWIRKVGPDGKTFQNDDLKIDFAPSLRLEDAALKNSMTKAIAYLLDLRSKSQKKRSLNANDFEDSIGPDVERGGVSKDFGTCGFRNSPTRTPEALGMAPPEDHSDTGLDWVGHLFEHLSERLIGQCDGFVEDAFAHKLSTEEDRRRHAMFASRHGRNRTNGKTNYLESMRIALTNGRTMTIKDHGDDGNPTDDPRHMVSGVSSVVIHHDGEELRFAMIGYQPQKSILAS